MYGGWSRAQFWPELSRNSIITELHSTEHGTRWFIFEPRPRCVMLTRLCVHCGAVELSRPLWIYCAFRAAVSHSTTWGVIHNIIHPPLLTHTTVLCIYRHTHCDLTVFQLSCTFTGHIIRYTLYGNKQSSQSLCDVAVKFSYNQVTLIGWMSPLHVWFAIGQLTSQ